VLFLKLRDSPYFTWGFLNLILNIHVFHLSHFTLFEVCVVIVTHARNCYHGYQQKDNGDQRVRLTVSWHHRHDVIILFYVFFMSSFIYIVIGIFHSKTTCAECKQAGLVGYRWKCTVCCDYDLCHHCYMAGKHDTSHAFFRIDTPYSQRFLFVF